MTDVNAQELHALAREVAAAIGPGWEYVQPGDESSNDIIRHRDGPSFSVTVVWNQPDRVQVHDFATTTAQANCLHCRA